MSPIFISHSSAFIIYRNNRNKLYPDIFLKTTARPKMSQHYTKTETSGLLKPYQAIIGKESDLLIKNKYSGHIVKNTKFHVHKYNFPTNSFLQLSDNLYISSPELVLCQLAESYPLIKLWQTVLEFCGTYSIDRNCDTGFHSMKAPLTNTTKLKKYIDQYKKHYSNLRGINNLLKIVTLINGRSASPQETSLYILLSAPRSIGGFAIKNLTLNKATKLSKKAESIGKQQTIIPDISNPKTKIAIEYDSNLFHNTINQNERDKLRLGALQHDKWQVFSIVPKQIKSPDALYDIAVDILKANKQDTRIKTKDFWFKFHDLHNTLYKQEW